ncbi:transcription factor [Fusarium longipes]|uniref:Transcription factor n=1 Tax=Fusarium longipes TaxID=694270 RepID=A0A395T2K8_9HYPO|nr:transcription factor [Fusarium longipes]
MSSVYPAYPPPPAPGDEIQVFDSYAPVPDMNAVTQGAPDLSSYGILPKTHWGQWWAPGDAAFAESTNAAAPNVSGQGHNFFHNHLGAEQDTVTQWDSPSTSVYSYPLPSPSTQATSVDVSHSNGESRRGSSATQHDLRTRKRSTASASASASKNQSQPPTTRSTRRASTRKTSKAESATTAAPENRKRNTKSKATAKPRRPPNKSAREEQYDDDDDQDAELDPEQQYEVHSKKVQERNRIASNKFRIKKREDAIQLRIDEEDMERNNRELNNCVADLTSQIYDLKMKLLQHTDCDCALIQDFIATEAQRYIKDLSNGKHSNATAPLPPQTPCYHMYHQHQGM